MELQIILMRGDVLGMNFQHHLNRSVKIWPWRSTPSFFPQNTAPRVLGGHVSVRRKVLGEVTLPVKPSQGPGTTADGDLDRKRLWPIHRCA